MRYSLRSKTVGGMVVLVALVNRTVAEIFCPNTIKDGGAVYLTTSTNNADEPSPIRMEDIWGHHPMAAITLSTTQPNPSR